MVKSDIVVRFGSWKVVGVGPCAVASTKAFIIVGEVDGSKAGVRLRQRQVGGRGWGGRTTGALGLLASLGSVDGERLKFRTKKYSSSFGFKFEIQF